MNLITIIAFRQLILYISNNDLKQDGLFDFKSPDIDFEEQRIMIPDKNPLDLALKTTAEVWYEW